MGVLAWQFAGFPWGMRVVEILVDAGIKSTALLCLAFAVTSVLRRNSAAVRHLVWVAALAALLVLPMFSLVLPAWNILPAWALPKVATSTAAISVTVVPTATSDVSSSRMPADFPSAVSQTPVTGEVTEPAAAMPPSPAPTMAAKVRTADRWPAGVILVWACGALLAITPMLAGLYTASRRRRQSTPVVDSDWRSLLQWIKQLLRIRRQVAVRKSPQCAVPLTFGILRPTILVSNEAETWLEERRRLVLLHELAHVKRLDCLTLLLANLVRSLYWFQPLAWLAASQVRSECERACDDVVLRAGAKSSDYASTLLEYAALPHASAPVGSLAMARPSSLEGRLLAILNPTTRRRALTRTAVLFVAILALSSVILVACLRARSPENPFLEGDLTPVSRAAVTGPATPTTRKIEGRIVDADGRPVFDAEVLVLRFAPFTGFAHPMEQEIVARTKSDPNGEIHIAGAGVHTFEEDVATGTSTMVVARKRDVGFGYNHMMGYPEYPARDGKIRNIVLHKTGHLEGWIVDESGQPIADAQVRADLSSDDQHDGPDVLGCPALDWFAARTGKDGRFLIPGVPTEYLAEFTVSAAGRATVSTERRIVGSDAPPQFRPGQMSIRIVLPPQRRIEGLALDKATGKPIAGVKLIAMRALRRGNMIESSDPLTPPAFAMTGKDGRFALDALEAGTWTIALAQQCISHRVEPGEWVAQPLVVDLTNEKSQSVHFELSHGEPVEVALVNGTTGKPVKGELSSWPSDPWWGALQRSDDQGIVHLRLLPGRYTLRASESPRVVRSGQKPPKWLNGRVDVTVVDGKSQRVQVRLENEPDAKSGVPDTQPATAPATTTPFSKSDHPVDAPRGSVTDPSGKPLAGARVTLYYVHSYSGLGNRSVETVTSDKSGKFEFSRPLTFAPQPDNPNGPDYYVLFAKHPDYAVGWTTLHANDHAELYVKLTAAERQTVHVVDAENHPLCDVRVALTRAGTSGFLPGPPPFPFFISETDPGIATETTNADGDATFVNLPKCSLLFTAFAAGYGPGYIELQGPTAQVKTLRIAPCAKIAGVVHDQNNAPISNAIVNLTAFFPYHIVRVPTDAAGRFSAELIGKGGFGSDDGGSGKYSLTIQHPDYVAKASMIEVNPGQRVEDYDVPAVAGAVLEGKVLEFGTEKPLAGARVSVTSEAGGGEIVSNKDGQFSVRVYPGAITCEYRGSPAGFFVPDRDPRMQVPQQLKIRPDQTEAQVTVHSPEKLRRLVSLHGTLLKPDGMPAAKVIMRPADFPRPATVDDQGHFTVTRIEAGETAHLYAQTPDRKLAVAVDIPVAMEPETQDLGVLTLQPTQDADVLIVDARGEPIAKTDIHMGPTFGKGLSVDGPSRTVATDEKGHLKVDGIIPGFRYWMRLGDGDKAAHANPVLLAKAGEKAVGSIMFSALLPLRVLDAAGEPVAIDEILEIRVDMPDHSRWNLGPTAKIEDRIEPGWVLVDRQQVALAKPGDLITVRFKSAGVKRMGTATFPEDETRLELTTEAPVRPAPGPAPAAPGTMPAAALPPGSVKIRIEPVANKIRLTWDNQSVDVTSLKLTGFPLLITEGAITSNNLFDSSAPSTYHDALVENINGQLRLTWNKNVHPISREFPGPFTLETGTPPNLPKPPAGAMTLTLSPPISADENQKLDIFMSLERSKYLAKIGAKEPLDAAARNAVDEEMKTHRERLAVGLYMNQFWGQHLGQEVTFTGEIFRSPFGQHYLRVGDDYKDVALDAKLAADLVPGEFRPTRLTGTLAVRTHTVTADEVKASTDIPAKLLPRNFSGLKPGDTFQEFFLQNAVKTPPPSAIRAANLHDRYVQIFAQLDEKRDGIRRLMEMDRAGATEADHHAESLKTTVALWIKIEVATRAIAAKHGLDPTIPADVPALPADLTGKSLKDILAIINARMVIPIDDKMAAEIVELLNTEYSKEKATTRPAPGSAPAAPGTMPATAPAPAAAPVSAPATASPPASQAAGPAPDVQAQAVAEIERCGGSVFMKGNSVVYAGFNRKSKLTDAVMKQIHNLTELQRLSFDYTTITDDQLHYLAGLNKLEELRLPFTSVSDSGMKSLQQLPRLNNLNLTNTKVTDAGVAQLSGVTQLQVIGLGNTKVSDKGLGSLKGLNELQEIQAYNTQVTSEGVKALQEALPKCKIIH